MIEQRRVIKEKLLDLRNAVNSAEGKKIIAAGKDYMVEAAAENLSADYLKGMGLLLDYLTKAEVRLTQFIQAEK